GAAATTVRVDSEPSDDSAPESYSPQSLNRSQPSLGSLSDSPGLHAPNLDAPGLDVEESLAEFRELVLSAGGQIVAELIQRRPRPDPATLIGSGKVEEIAAVAASTHADL